MWLHSLEQMDASLGESERELVAHEQSLAGLLTERKSSGALQAAETLLAQIDERLARHERSQQLASERVADFESWLGEQDNSLGRWRSAFTEWCGRIQQTP